MSRSPHATLGTGSDGKLVPLDVQRLLETRALLFASSGWGKSWALRRLIEQSHGQGAMQIVIDPEGEFSSLREHYDFVIAGKGGDCPAEPRSAELLARRLLELGCDAVLDLYELRAKPRGADHVTFVRKFLEAMISAPKALWRPVLVFVDEMHLFAPENGQAESRDAVRALMATGRKRGYAGIGATQRIAKLDKDACDASNVLVGRHTLDVDVTRAGDFLGFSKARRPEIQRLGVGEFFAFGPALGEDLQRVKVGTVLTTHPRAGQRAAAPPAPRTAVLRALEQLRDLPAQAEAEVRTAAELRARVAELQHALEAEKRRPAPEPRVVTAQLIWASPQYIADIRARSSELAQLADRMESANAQAKPTPLAPAENFSSGSVTALPAQPVGGVLRHTKNVARPAPRAATERGWDPVEEDQYQKWKSRLIEELRTEQPALLRVAATSPELEVTVERRVIELDSKTLRGRIAQMIAEDYFTETRNGNTTFVELKRLAVPCAKPSVYGELDKLAALGLLTKEHDGYRIAPGAKVRLQVNT